MVWKCRTVFTFQLSGPRNQTLGAGWLEVFFVFDGFWVRKCRTVDSFGVLGLQNVQLSSFSVFYRYRMVWKCRIVFTFLLFLHNKSQPTQRKTQFAVGHDLSSHHIGLAILCVVDSFVSGNATFLGRNPALVVFSFDMRAGNVWCWRCELQAHALASARL